MKPFMTPL